VNPDVVKTRIDQRFLYRVDRVAAERHLIELRWVGSKETSDDFMRDPAKPVVPVRIPDAEQIAATERKHAMGLSIGAVFVREKHYPELGHNGVKRSIREREIGRIGGSEIHTLIRPRV
jgi:hypothetical protein